MDGAIGFQAQSQNNIDVLEGFWFLPNMGPALSDQNLFWSNVDKSV